MPHQCLSCGHLFEEGSSAILAGCPQCEGTRFFYTNKEVDEEERRQLQDKAQKDLNGVVTELLQEAAPEVAARLEETTGEDGWASLRPRDLRRLIKEVQAEKAKRPEEHAEVDPQEIERRRRAVEQALLELQEEEEEKPDTVTIREPGDYAIDIKGLLEQDPLVVQKDGHYLIHLPSLFDNK